MTYDAIRLTLPLPPSVNGLFIWKGKKRIKSPKYRNWLSGASKIILEAELKITGTEWLEATVIMFMPIYCKNGNKKIEDLDNLLKATFDSLAYKSVGDNQNIPGFKDHLIKKIIASKIDSPRNEVEIVIKEI